MYILRQRRLSLKLPGDRPDKQKKNYFSYDSELSFHLEQIKQAGTGFAREQRYDPAGKSSTVRSDGREGKKEFLNQTPPDINRTGSLKQVNSLEALWWEITQCFFSSDRRRRNKNHYKSGNSDNNYPEIIPI